jgi:hypothetical protein
LNGWLGAAFPWPVEPQQDGPIVLNRVLRPVGYDFYRNPAEKRHSPFAKGKPCEFPVLIMLGKKCATRKLSIISDYYCLGSVFVGTCNSEGYGGTV